MLAFSLLRPVHAQGTFGFGNWPEVAFVTYAPEYGIDAPVSFNNGTRIGPEFTGQLFGGPAGTPVSALEPLYPIASFTYFPDQPEYNGYIFTGGGVHVPHLNSMLQATVVLRAYNGSSWDTSTYRGESGPITVQFFNPSGPDAILSGLQGFTVEAVPEPGTICLLAGGGLMLVSLGRATVKNKQAKHRTM